MDGFGFRVSPAVGSNEFRITLSMISNYTNARVDIYDATGRLQRSFDGVSDDLVWSGDDNLGSKVPPGAYFIRLSADGPTGELSRIHKIVLVR